MQLKRLFASLLVVILILSAAALTVSANNEENFEFAVEYSSTAGSGETLVAKPGDTVEVSIVIQQNPGASLIGISVEYDPAVLSPALGEDGTAKYELNEDLSYDHFDTMLPEGASGVVFANGKVTYHSNLENIQNHTDTGALLTLYFVVADGETCGSSAITVTGAKAHISEGNGYVTEEGSVIAKNIATVENDVATLHVHTGDITETVVPPTCTEAGKVTMSCSACGEVFATVEGAPATGHTVVTVPGQDATCSATGKTAEEKCSVCGTILKASETIAMKEHTPVVKDDGSTVCSVCGAVLLEAPDEGGSLAWLWITIIVVVVVAGGAVLAYFLIAKKKKK